MTQCKPRKRTEGIKCVDLNTLWGYSIFMQQPVQKKVVRRLKTIEGQVRGLQRMVENDVYCIDIITQTSAVRQALSAVEDALLETHLGSCVVSQIRGGADTKAIREILSVYKISKKK